MGDAIQGRSYRSEGDEYALTTQCVTMIDIALR